MRKPEKDHIAKVGEAKFERALGLAMVAIRQDSHLIGMDKIRGAIAEEAALVATGFPPRGLSIPKACGEPTQEVFDICERVLKQAIEAAAH